MKYKFANNADLPEWVLAEVSTLSKISCVRLKLITRCVITELSGGMLDIEKVTKLVPPTGISWSDIKAMLAAISFILTGAVRNAVDEGAFVCFVCCGPCLYLQGRGDLCIVHRACCGFF